MSVPSATLAPNPWLRVLDALEKKINRPAYDRWLKPTRYSHASGGILYVRVETEEARRQNDRYLDLIQEALDNLGLDYQEVQFVTAESDPAATPLRHDGGLSAVPVPTAHVSQARFDFDGAAQLNPRYTFDAFVIGSGNQFAHAACQAVAERPSKAYNPLFLYGGVGMGKTHLMQAIGHEIAKRLPQAAICYVSSDKFTNDMINSLRYDKMTSFRDKFRNMDVLLIDDIQFIAQKERTQEEFFHTFNALHESMKQIVIASDRPPKELAEIEDRLRSRFEWGLTTDVQPPELETRLAILRKKADNDRIPIPGDVLELIATHVRDNIRELEGALIRVSAYASLNREPPTLEMAERVLSDILDAGRPRQITPKVILEATSSAFGFTVEDICGTNRRRPLVNARQIGMYVFRELTDFSYPAIAREFGGRDHTTVIHAVEKVSGLMKERRQVYDQVTELIYNIKGGR